MRIIIRIITFLTIFSLLEARTDHLNRNGYKRIKRFQIQGRSVEGRQLRKDNGDENKLENGLKGKERGIGKDSGVEAIVLDGERYNPEAAFETDVEDLEANVVSGGNGDNGGNGGNGGSGGNGGNRKGVRGGAPTGFTIISTGGTPTAPVLIPTTGGGVFVTGDEGWENGGEGGESEVESGEGVGEGEEGEEEADEEEDNDDGDDDNDDEGGFGGGPGTFSGCRRNRRKCGGNGGNGFRPMGGGGPFVKNPGNRNGNKNGIVVMSSGGDKVVTNDGSNTNTADDEGATTAVDDGTGTNGLVEANGDLDMGTKTDSGTGTGTETMTQTTTKTTPPIATNVNDLTFSTRRKRSARLFNALRKLKKI